MRRRRDQPGESGRDRSGGRPVQAPLFAEHHQEPDPDGALVSTHRSSDAARANRARAAPAPEETDDRHPPWTPAHRQGEHSSRLGPECRSGDEAEPSSQCRRLPLRPRSLAAKRLALRQAGSCFPRQAGACDRVWPGAHSGPGTAPVARRRPPNREAPAPGKDLLGALDFKRLRYVMVRS